jgi:hypothetical protein
VKKQSVIKAAAVKKKVKKRQTPDQPKKKKVKAAAVKKKVKKRQTPDQSTNRQKKVIVQVGSRIWNNLPVTFRLLNAAVRLWNSIVHHE